MILNLLGLQKNTELISIGLVAEDGQSFYAEFEGIDVDNQDDWIKENVLKHTILYGEAKAYDIVNDNTVLKYGNKTDIKYALEQWLDQFDEVQLISDVGHYDMVLFIDIFGSAFDLPSNINPSYHDINQDIAEYELITEKEAFDTNREDFINRKDKTLEGKKHNSLHDAYVIKTVYEIVKNRII